jgi:hypothetical protein
LKETERVVFVNVAVPVLAPLVFGVIMLPAEIDVSPA